MTGACLEHRAFWCCPWGTRCEEVTVLYCWIWWYRGEFLLEPWTISPELLRVRQQDVHALAAPRATTAVDYLSRWKKLSKTFRKSSFCSNRAEGLEIERLRRTKSLLWKQNPNMLEQVAALACKVLLEKCLCGTMKTWLLGTLSCVQSRVIQKEGYKSDCRDTRQFSIQHSVSWKESV